MKGGLQKQDFFLSLLWEDQVMVCVGIATDGLSA